MRSLILNCVAAGLMSNLALAAGPAKDKSLEEILDAVERAGYTAVTEVSFDDGVWEIESLKDARPMELRVSPTTAEILGARADEPHPALPQTVRPLGDIARQLAADGYAHITQLDLEPAGWEVECSRNGRRRDLLVDFASGKVLSDQADD